MTHRILHESHRFNANTANTHAICKNAFYVGWWVKAGSTQLLSLRACLYINRHESCSASVSSNVCAAAYEHRAERGGVKFKDAFAFWFAAVPFEQLLTLYTCTHTFKVSFSQHGTLAFAACLSNLTSKGLGHLSLSLSLSLSLHHFPLRACTWDHTVPARARLSRPRRESPQKWNTASLARSRTIRDISADKKEKKQQRGQMFAQQTSLQVFLLAPVACRRQESSIFGRNCDFFEEKQKTHLRLYVITAVFFLEFFS